MMKQNLLLLSAVTCSMLHAETAGPYPIQFSIPECKIVTEVADKTMDFAFIMPGLLRTYVYNDEASYYQGYKAAYFAITRCKGGWDCMRHYEILAAGCIPYFVDIENCNPKTMELLPRKLLLEAMSLPGVPRLSHYDVVTDAGHVLKKLKIDHSRFDSKRYYEILNELLEYTRRELTTKALGRYMLNSIGYSGSGKVLFLSGEVTPADYLRETGLIGLKEMLGTDLVDYPKIPFLYDSYEGDTTKLYGKGFSYSKTLKDVEIDRSNIEERIRNKEFELIFYGSVHRGTPFHDLVRANYPKEKIAYACGEDAHVCEYSNQLHHLFLREFDGNIGRQD